MGVEPGRAFAVDPVDPTELRALAPLVGRLRGHLGDLETRVGREKLDVELGGYAADAVRRRLLRVPGARDVASGLVSGAFTSGLAVTYEQADAQRLFAGWQCSAVLDRATCPECAARDGRTYATLEEAYRDLPGFGPNPRCHGDGRCRCRLVPTGAAGAGQNPPVASGGGTGGGGGGGTPPGPPGFDDLPPDEQARRLTAELTDWRRQIYRRPDLLDAIREWSGPGFRVVSDVLLTPGGLARSEYAQRVVNGLDEAIALGRLSRSVVVYRGVGPRVAHLFTSADPINLVGAIDRRPTFFATSVDPSAAAARAQSGGVILRVLVPAGTRAAWLAELAVEHPLERELLLGRQTRYRILRFGEYHGREMFVVEVLPR
ncbi:MAG: hypothetical protein IT201_12855 [Thermoleophilia bacterium]|nr:hypothetical protein [Thermoleophilia bacterium]